MSIRIEITKNNIPIESLEDETLVELFNELIPQRDQHKCLMQAVIKTLLKRNKLYLITKGRFHVNYDR
jgi:hypothetical protein